MPNSTRIALISTRLDKGTTQEKQKEREPHSRPKDQRTEVEVETLRNKKTSMPNSQN